MSHASPQPGPLGLGSLACHSRLFLSPSSVCEGNSCLTAAHTPTWPRCQNITFCPELFGSNGKNTCWLRTLLPFHYPREFGRNGLFQMVMTALCRSRGFWILLLPLLDIQVRCSASLSTVWEQLPEVEEIHPIIYPLHPVAYHTQNLPGLMLQRGLLFNYKYTSNMQAGRIGRSKRRAGTGGTARNPRAVGSLEN